VTRSSAVGPSSKLYRPSSVMAVMQRSYARLISAVLGVSAVGEASSSA
jgi:hypothetical protein